MKRRPLPGLDGFRFLFSYVQKARVVEIACVLPLLFKFKDPRKIRGIRQSDLPGLATCY